MEDRSTLGATLGKVQTNGGGGGLFESFLDFFESVATPRGVEGAKLLSVAKQASTNTLVEHHNAEKHNTTVVPAAATKQNGTSNNSNRNATPNQHEMQMGPSTAKAAAAVAPTGPTAPTVPTDVAAAGRTGDKGRANNATRLSVVEMMHMDSKRTTANLGAIAWDEPSLRKQGGGILEINKIAMDGWILYDAAQSVYTLAVGFFLPRFIKDQADSLGYSGKQFWQYTSVVTTVVGLFAFLTFCSIGEYGELKHTLWKTFARASAVCFMLFCTVVVRDLVWLAALLTIFARVGNRIAGIFYGAMLAEVAPVEGLKHKTSSRGAAAGYAGSIVWFVCVGVVFLVPNDRLFGTDWLAYRLPLFAAGLWWIVVAQRSFDRVESVTGKEFPPNFPLGTLYHKARFAFVCGTRDLWTAIKVVWTQREHRKLKLYVLAWIFLSDATSTATTAAAIIAEDELNLSDSWLAGVAVIGFVVAGFGALFAYRINRILNNPNLLLMINVVILTMLLGWAAFMNTKLEICLISAVAGFQIGCIAALGRSVLSNLIPKGNFQTPIFALWEFSQKGTSWIGPLVVGILTGVYGDSSYKVIVILVVLFEVAIGFPIFVYAVFCG